MVLALGVDCDDLLDVGLGARRREATKGEKVTHVDYVPTMLEVLLEAEGLERCENLKIVTAAGAV